MLYEVITVVPLVESIIPSNVPGNAEPTWFELVTLFAFVAFREAGLDWAVIETGLGGRLDATNVIIPEAAVITPVITSYSIHYTKLYDAFPDVEGKAFIRRVRIKEPV